MLICQGFRFSNDLGIGNVFVQSEYFIAFLFKELSNSGG